jgi:ribosomal protein S6--L-glutamate ligase
MTRVAITTEPEFERLESPLRERGLDPVFVPTEERATPLSATDRASADIGFVYPQRAAEGGVLDAHLDIPWVNDREAMLRSRFKGETIARLQAAGLPTPKTTLISNPFDRGDLPAAYERFDPPLLLKPNYATRGEGIIKLVDYDSLSGAVDYVDLLHTNPTVGDQTYLLQEFIPDARDYRAMVVDYDYAGAVERRFPEDGQGPELNVELAGDSDADRRLGRWKHNVHRGAVAREASFPTELRRMAEEVAEVLEIPWLGVDFLVTDDRAVVNETNARPTVDDPAKYEPGFYDRLSALIRSRA